MKILDLRIPFLSAITALVLLQPGFAQELVITAPIMEVAVPCKIIYIAEEKVILGSERIEGKMTSTLYFDTENRPMKECQLEKGENIKLKAVKIGASYFAMEIYKKREQ